MTDKSEQIYKLIDLAAAAHDGAEAMRYSQAAQNVANALCALQSVEDAKR